MLNYAVIIQYLTQQLNIPNVRIAEWLNLDPSIISNIKNNKRKMQKDISYDVFYRDVFCQAEIGTDSTSSVIPFTGISKFSPFFIFKFKTFP